MLFLFFFDHVTLTFDLLTITDQRGMVMNYPSIPVPSLAILFSAVLVLSCGQTNKQTDRITDADDRYTDATTASASNNTK